jgi:pimeloyl-ACP methyl ester carboxylesterase
VTTLSLHRLNTRVAVGAGAGAVLVAGGAWATRRHLHQLAADAELGRLSDPLRGEPVEVRSADGTRLHAEAFGDGGAPTVVLIPGWTEQIAIFDPMTRRLLDAGFRVVAYDLRGQGGSREPLGRDYAVERYGEDVEAVVAATCEGRHDVIVAGHSLGGMSIASWAAGHDVAARAAACVLMNTGFDGLLSASKLIPAVLPGVLHRLAATHGFMANPLPLPPLSTPISTGAIRYAAFGPDAKLAHVALYERMLIACPPRVRAAAGLMMASMDLSEAVSRITVPTLVVAGDRDLLTPETHARKIADALPDLDRLLILERTGHMGPLERPAEIVEAIAALRERVLGAGAPAQALSS